MVVNNILCILIFTFSGILRLLFFWIATDLCDLYFLFKSLVLIPHYLFPCNFGDCIVFCSCMLAMVSFVGDFFDNVSVFMSSLDIFFVIVSSRCDGIECIVVIGFFVVWWCGEIYLISPLSRSLLCQWDPWWRHLYTPGYIASTMYLTSCGGTLSRCLLLHSLWQTPTIIALRRAFWCWLHNMRSAVALSFASK